MKKVSTAATKQSRNISRQTLTVGLYLGDRNSWYCVLDESGGIQLEQRVDESLSRVRMEAWRQWLLGQRKTMFHKAKTQSP